MSIRDSFLRFYRILLSTFVGFALLFVCYSPPSAENNLVHVDEIRQLPIIFIGGYSRSGTTLMRAILDVHPAVSCGPETIVIDTFLDFLKGVYSDSLTQNRLKQAGVELQTVSEAATSFIYHILKNRKANNFTHGSGKWSDTRRHLCTKDPDILHHMSYLHEIFPNAKFIHMIRDGRVAAYSFMVRVGEKMQFNQFLRYFNSWNNYNTLISTECELMGKAYCHTVRYEDLIVNTQPVLKGLVKFLGLRWKAEMLQHEKHIGGSVKVSELEWSTSQVKQKIYNDSLVPPFFEKIWDYNPALLDKSVLSKYHYNLTLDAIRVKKIVP